MADEKHARGQWTGKLDFILSGIGYAVGLGNVWRFPFLCYRNGGASFLIPYVIMLTFVALPVFFMELSIGQYSSLGPVGLYGRMAPITKGVGVGMVVVSAFVSVYYNMIIAWSLFYLFASFTSHLPWQDCDQPWTTEKCFDDRSYKACMKQNDTVYLGKCFDSTEYPNITEIPEDDRLSAPEEYYRYYMLGQSPGIDHLEKIRWQLLLCLVLAFVIVGASLIRGVKSSGKVVYFTAVFPYIVLIILFFRGITLDGAINGIKFYIIPEWEKLTEMQVWLDAAGQIFYSTSIAWGGLITLASYNDFHNNVLRDTLVICIGNCATSVFAGFVIFSILGFMAEQLGKEVGEVAVAGSGLAFIAYPDALTRLPISPLWAVLFFIMLVTLGLDSEFGSIETVTTAIYDAYPKLRSKKWLVVGGTCLVMFVLGLPLVSNAGIYWLELFNDFPSAFPLLFLGIMECVSVGWIYGADRLREDVRTMTGHYPIVGWKVCWLFISPVLTTGIFVASVVKWKLYSYDGYVYPTWSQVMGWIIALIPMLIVFVYAFRVVIRNKTDDKTWMQTIREQCQTTPDWDAAASPSASIALGKTNYGARNHAYDNQAADTEKPESVYPHLPQNGHN